MYAKTAGQLLALFLFVGLCASNAQLKWTAPEQVAKPPPGSRDVAYVYLFRNDSKQPVTLIKIVPSCSCITTTHEKATYAPGESGALRVNFHVAGMTGHQTKTIEVTTDASAGRTTTLRVTAELTEAFTVTPRLLRWNLGELPNAKHATARINPGSLLGPPAIAEVPSGFTAKMQSKTGIDAETEILVSPLLTTSKQRGTLLLQFPGPDNSKVGVRVVLIVE